MGKTSLIIGGTALLLGGFIAYKHYKKSKEADEQQALTSNSVAASTPNIESESEDVKDEAATNGILGFSTSRGDMLATTLRDQHQGLL